jgi:hypothetical protein
MARALLRLAALASFILALAPGLAMAADGVAVIIGNQRYRGDVPADEHAIRDALLMRRYLTERVGYAPENVILLENATQDELAKTLGTPLDPGGALKDRVHAGRTAVLVYYSGHGVPGRLTGQAFLLPVDGDPEDPSATGYAVADLYHSVLALDPRSLVLVLDASFSADSFAGAVMQSPANLAEGALDPPRGSPVTLLAATTDVEFANEDQQVGIGLFTRYLLLGMDGGADLHRKGNQNGEVTLNELDAWFEDELGFAARRDFGRSQRPTLIGNPNAVLSRRAGDTWPPRPTKAGLKLVVDALARQGAEPVPAAGPLPVPAAVPPTRAALPADALAPAPLAAPAPAPSPVIPPPIEALEAPADAAPAITAATAGVDQLEAREPADAAATISPSDAEAALGLSRAQRVAIQRKLADLGHPVGDIDGSFGSRTRDAMKSWQTSVNLPPTGYVDAGQLATLTGP